MIDEKIPAKPLTDDQITLRLRASGIESDAPHGGPNIERMRIPSSTIAASGTKRGAGQRIDGEIVYREEEQLAPSAGAQAGHGVRALSKLIERKGEKARKSPLSTERHRQMAEVPRQLLRPDADRPGFRTTSSRP